MILFVHRDPVKISIAYSTAKGALATPGTVRSDGHLGKQRLNYITSEILCSHLSTMICLRVVDIQLERSALVSLDQTVEVLALVQHAVCSYDVVTELSQARQLGRTVPSHVQDVPHILIGSLEAAEPDADAQQSLASPQCAGSDEQLPDCPCLAAVHRHANLLLNVGL